MEVTITIKRITEYTTTVNMEQSVFDRLTKAVYGGGRGSREAEKELNNLIDTNDWQDDEFHELVSFEPCAD